MTSPIAREACDKIPSKASPGNFVLFCKLKSNSPITAEIIKT